MAVKRYRGQVFGKVQGVFFRATAKEVADQLGLVGWIRNEPDGSVRFEVEGPEEALQAFLRWARQGPPRARVDQLVVEEVPPQGTETAFQIRY